MKIKAILYILTSICVLSSCQPEECISTKTNNVKFQFLDTETNKELTLRVVKASPEASDSVLIKNKSVSEGQLEVNPADTTTTFDFTIAFFVLDTIYSDPPDNTDIDHYDTLQKDTLQYFLRLSYLRSSRVISPECGVEQSIKKLKATDFNFDSLKVTDSEPDIFDKVNVKIYF